ncbi:hypothetical protein [Streptomyces sp. NPDC090022]|uniref:hypothetical protein n=1 Tax=Streptomyces sp. NPDC090022 TaxID=3365920 RepID=UPI003818C4E5
MDPLEIAAGLEAHGITDRTAARFRHRDVFSLAEELYARVPPADGAGGPPRSAAGAGGADAAARRVTPRALRAVGYAVLPGAVALLATVAAALADGRPLLPGAAGGALGAGALGTGAGWAAVVAVLAVVAGLGRPRRRTLAVQLLAAAATGYAVHRHGLALGVGLALAVAPAHLAGGWFAARARRRLGSSPALADFAAGARPLLVAAVVAYAALALPLLALAGAPPLAAAPLAVLLFLARLLLRHGTGRAPVLTVFTALAAGAVPALAAAGLLVHAVFALSRASAHAHT